MLLLSKPEIRRQFQAMSNSKTVPHEQDWLLNIECEVSQAAFLPENKRYHHNNSLKAGVTQDLLTTAWTQRGLYWLMLRSYTWIFPSTVLRANTVLTCGDHAASVTWSQDH